MKYRPVNVDIISEGEKTREVNAVRLNIVGQRPTKAGSNQQRQEATNKGRKQPTKAGSNQQRQETTNKGRATGNAGEIVMGLLWKAVMVRNTYFVTGLASLSYNNCL